MPSIISFVGLSGSGKTTLLEKIIKDLKSRGYKVATVKHAGHGSSLDEPGKDSYRHLQAGSDATIVYAHDRLMLIKPVPEDISIEEIAKVFGDEPDIVLIEGFKSSDTPKIEVHRKTVGPPLKDLKKLIAIATDEPLKTRTRQFSLDDAVGITDFIEASFLKPKQPRRRALHK